MPSELTLVEAIKDALDVELGRDDETVLYGQDVGIAGGVFRATDELIDRHPEQVYDAPVAESGIVGMGVGLSAYGKRPVAEIQFSGFLLEHHSESFAAGYAHVPGLQVVVPSSPANAKGLLAASIRDPDPVVFLEPMRIYRSVREEVPEGEHTTPLGEAAVVEEGEDLTLIAWGALLRDARRAAASVDADVEVVDPRTLSPLDTETIVDSVKKTGRCVVAHEAPKSGGLGAEITARINDEALVYLEAPVERVAGYDVPYPLFAREENYLPDAGRIEAAIERAVEF